MSNLIRIGKFFCHVVIVFWFQLARYVTTTLEHEYIYGDEIE